MRVKSFEAALGRVIGLALMRRAGVLFRNEPEAALGLCSIARPTGGLATMEESPGSGSSAMSSGNSWSRPCWTRSPGRRPGRGRAFRGRVRGAGLGGARPGPLRLVGGRAPRPRGRCARAHPGGALRPRERAEPEHRPAEVAEDVRPAPRRLQLRARLEPSGRPGGVRGRTGRSRRGRIGTRRRSALSWRSSRTPGSGSGSIRPALRDRPASGHGGPLVAVWLMHRGPR